MSITTRISYTADGISNIYTVPFDYLSRSHVFMKINGVESEFTWLTAYTVQPAIMPVSGTVIEIYRNTPYEEQFVSWSDGTVLFSADLNAQALQTLFVLQENEQIRIEAQEARDEALTIKEDTQILYDNTATARDAAVLAKSEAEQYRNESMACAHAASVSAASAEDYKDLTVAAAQVLPWDIETTYNFPDLVARPNGHTYRCIGNDVTGTEPENSVQWVCITTFVGAPWPDGEAFIDGGTF